MKNIKYIIILLTILLLIIIGIFIAIYYTNNKSETPKVTQYEQKSTPKQNVATEEVTNSAMYFTVKSCIDKYMKYLSEQNKEAIYSLLNPNYIEDKKINSDNVLEYVEILEGKNLDFSIQEMRTVNEGEEIQTYYINGTMRNERNDKKEVKFTINIDITNKVFTVIPSVIEGVFDE